MFAVHGICHAIILCNFVHFIFASTCTLNCSRRSIISYQDISHLDVFRKNHLSIPSKDRCVCRKASIDLANHFAATGAGLGVIANQGGGLKHLGRTRMRGILFGTLDFKAVGTDPSIAEATLPGARQEAITAGCGTASHEFRRDGARWLFRVAACFGQATADTIDASPNGGALIGNDEDFLTMTGLYLGKFVQNDGVLFAEGAYAEGPFCGELVIGQETLFAIDKNRLAMRIVGLVEKRVGTSRAEKGAGPGRAAIDTVGIFDGAQQVPLDTLGTEILVARRALDALSQDGCVRFGANAARGDRFYRGLFGFRCHDWLVV